MDEILRQLEEKRARALKAAKPAIVLMVVGGIFLLLAFMNMPTLVIGLPLFLIGIFWYFLKAGKLIKEFNNSYKTNLIEAILREQFTELEFFPNQGISEQVIKNLGMIQLGNRYASDDYIRGKYKNTLFEQADVCIQNVTTDSEGHTHTTTYFKGRWMIFDFNKEFLAEMQVVQRGFTYAKRKSGWFSKQEERFKKVEMEDTDFNRDFHIYAQSEHEAFYILTPHIMASIRTLDAMTNGKIILCFSRTKLHVGVNNNKNAFEPSVFRKVDASIIESVRADIHVITRFVDEMNLDRSIFKATI